MMKGKLRQLISILLISVLVLSMAAPGFAANEEEASTYTLTINSQTDGHTFELYQIFQGEVATDSNSKTVLTHIKWGESISDYETLVAALQSDSDLAEFFADVDTDATEAAQAVAVAAGLSKTIKDSSASALADQFAEVAEAKLSKTPYKSTASSTKAGDGVSYVYEISGIVDGYYLLKDKDDSLNSDDTKDTAAYTKYIIGIIGEDVTIDAKADKPNIDKHVVNPHNDDDPTLEKTEEYSIGDDIIYQLDSQVPNMDGYTRYWYMAQDTLSKGLTFVKINSITVGDDTTVTEGSGNQTYTLYKESQSDGTTVISIVFNNFLETYKEMAGEKIVIKYTVRLNEYANVGSLGNDNKVSLIYSNNPYDSSNYEKEPTPDYHPGTGETTSKKTVTYTTQLSIIKIDADTEEPLSGVTFVLAGSGSQVVYTLTANQSVTYEVSEDNDGDFVEVDGVYVTYDADTHGTDVTRYNQVITSSSENMNVEYIMTTHEKTEEDDIVGGTGSGKITGVTGSDGMLTFTGLGEGTYTLTETGAPAGYNLLTKPITVTIYYEDPLINGKDQSNLTVFDQPTKENLANWSYTYTYMDNGVEKTTDKKSLDDGCIEIKVTNTSSALLPSTGGVGTVVFTVAGICAMAGAVVFLYIKKRREEL